MTFPSDRSETLIEVFFLSGHSPFVCGMEGCIAGDMIAQIEEDLDDEPGRMDKGDGSYLYRVVWEPDQTGDYGRVELPGYWDLSFVAFKPMPTS